VAKYLQTLLRISEQHFNNLFLINLKIHTSKFMRERGLNVRGEDICYKTIVIWTHFKLSLEQSQIILAVSSRLMQVYKINSIDLVQGIETGDVTVSVASSSIK
jgi:hypothetical protein